MKTLTLAALAAAALLPVACAGLTTPAPVPGPTAQQDVLTAFTLADVALSSLPLVPGVSPTVAAEARAADTALKAAWSAYLASPNDPAMLTGLKSALAGAQALLAALPPPPAPAP